MGNNENRDIGSSELISSIVDNSVRLVVKGGNVIDVPITNITVDAQYKNGGLVTVDVRVGFKEERD